MYLSCVSFRISAFYSFIFIVILYYRLEGSAWNAFCAVESQMKWFHWMSCIVSRTLLNELGLRFTMIGIFIQFQLSDQHSSVMSVEMQVHNSTLASHYGGIILGGAGRQITLDGHHHNRANKTTVSHWLSLCIAIPCWPFEDSHCIRAFVQAPTHITCVLIFDSRSHFHRAHYLSAHDTGSECYEVRNVGILWRIVPALPGHQTLNAQYWMPNTGCQKLAA